MRFSIVPRRVACLTAFILALECGSLSGGAIASTPTSAAKPRVVLISLDGTADWLLDDLLASGQLPAGGGFARLIGKGIRADTMTPVNVASTQPSHASLFTGLPPSKTGTVGSYFMREGKRVSGFRAPLEGEPIWQTVMKRGMKAVCLATPFADLSSPQRSCTRTLPFGATETEEGHVVLLKSGSSDSLQGDVRALEPVQGLLDVRVGDTIIPLMARARRTVEGKWSIAVEDSHGISTILREGSHIFIPLAVPGRRLQVPILLQQASDDLSIVRIYVGMVSGTPEGPATDDAFVQGFDKTIGLFPPDVDYEALMRRDISADEWEQQNEALARYIQRAMLSQLSAPDWDLLTTYIPTIDNAEHRFLLTDPRQADYAAEDGRRRQDYNQRVLRSYQLVDDLLRSFLDAAPPGTNFVVVSDHGAAPTHSTILLHNYIEEAGFAVESQVPDVFVVPRQADADLYINLAGRDPEGRIPASQYSATVEKLASALRSLKDPVTGKSVFHIVAAREESEKLGIFFPGHSGDLFVSAAPGFGLYRRYIPGAPIIIPISSELDTQSRLASEDPARAPVYRSARQFDLTPGLHGHTGDWRALESIFIASGPSIPKIRLGRMHVLDVAPTVAALLGADPAPEAKGRALFK